MNEVPIQSIDTEKQNVDELFSQSILNLVLLGQLPILVISVASIIILMVAYNSIPPYFIFLVLSVIIASISSTFALCKHNMRAYHKAVFSLYISLVSTMVCIHFLIYITNGTKGPFQHLYLYLPAVVFMVTQKQKIAEWLCVLYVLGSYYFNFFYITQWDAWETFN